MDIEKIVNEAFADVCKGKNITKETLIKDLGIDSLDLVESLMNIEEKLGIEFSDDEMTSFKVVDDVYKAIANKVNK